MCEVHDRQRQSKIGGSDSEASSRFQEEQGVACSLISVCTLGSEMGSGRSRGSEYPELWGPMQSLGFSLE